MAESKQAAVALETEQACSAPKAAASLDITEKWRYNSKAKFEAEQSGGSLNKSERAMAKHFFEKSRNNLHY